ncbi:MAG: hypothetical protein L3J89_00385 [Gammaproteobacteria bacterium]|nr:hypothetical protein [Gammaproteobacteria bacterium]
MNRQSQNHLWPLLFVLLLAIIAVFSLKAKQDEANKPTFISGWKDAASFIEPRRALAAVTYNNHLYVLGGIDAGNRYVRTVEYTKIRADGSLGKWQKTSRLNEGRFYLAAAASNGYLFAIGGAKGVLGKHNTPVATVEKAKINPDGSLGRWVLTGDLTTPRRGLTVNQYGNRIYALGGYNGIFLHSIEQTTVNKNGQLSEWALSPQQSTVDRYIHSSAIAGENLYLLAGHMKNSQTVSYGDVELSQISDSGALSPWRIENTMLLTPRFIASAFSLGSYLYLLAGHDGAKRLRSVEFTLIDQSGHVGRWQRTAPLKIARSGTATVTHNQRVYVLGGISQNKVLNHVETAIQIENGNLGNFSVVIR